MDVIALPALKDNYIWCLKQTNKNQLVCIDPGDAKPVIDYCIKNKLMLAAILITHHHWDHTNGIPKLLEHWPVPVYGPDNPAIHGLTHGLKHGDEVNIANLRIKLKVMGIPGHTLDHIAYIGHGKCFCGDTLFAAGCGRIFEGSIEQMYQSLQQLKGLPKKTLIYPAHEYTVQNLRFAKACEPSNLKIDECMMKAQAARHLGQPTLPTLLSQECEVNPFLRCGEDEIRHYAELNANAPMLNNQDVFAVIRQWKNRF